MIGCFIPKEGPAMAGLLGDIGVAGCESGLDALRSLADYDSFQPSANTLPPPPLCASMNMPSSSTTLAPIADRPFQPEQPPNKSKLTHHNPNT